MLKIKVNDVIVSKHPTYEAAMDRKHEIIHWAMKIATWLGGDVVTTVDAEGAFHVHALDKSFKIQVML